MFRSTVRNLSHTAFSTARVAAGAPTALLHLVTQRLGRQQETTRAAEATTAPPQREAPAPREQASPSSDSGPEVVLAMDAPPEEVEPPVDVVGEALAQDRTPPPTPDHVETDAAVVYSSETAPE